MISGNFKHCGSVEQFNKEIVTLLQLHHGKEYTLNHDELNNLIDELNGDKKYSSVAVKEIGVNQGGSLSSILLNPGADLIIGIDNVPENFYPYEKLFIDFAKDEYKKFSFQGISSLNQKAIDIKCDILHIDSLHEYEHLKKELLTHAPNTSKYILIHDTKLYSKQVKAIHEFIKAYPEWKIKKVNKQSVGYHVLEKESK